jgi:hypothetical protein
MTPGEALELKTFDHRCTCGGYAYTFNGRPPMDPHMSWCPQRAQFMEWQAALPDGHELKRRESP